MQYLIKSKDSSIYYFRRRIPKRVRQYFTSDFFTISTRIDSLTFAQRIEHSLSRIFDSTIIQLALYPSDSNSIIQNLKSTSRMLVDKYNYPEFYTTLESPTTIIKPEIKVTKLEYLIEDYIEYRRKKYRIRDSSVISIDSYLKSFISSNNLKTNQDITVDKLSDYISKELEKNKESTVKQKIITLKAFLKYLSDNDYLHYTKELNSVFDIKLDITSPKAEFTLEQLQTLFSADYSDMNRIPEYYFVPLISLVTGMRLREITSLNKDEIHIEDQYIYFVIKRSKTFSGIRTVSIRKELPFIPSFLKYLDFIPDSAPVFSRRVHSISMHFTELLIQLNIKESKDIYNNTLVHSFHSLRHNFNCKLESMLIPDTIKDVLLGHSPKSKLATYSKKEDRTKELFDTVISKLDFSQELINLQSPKFALFQTL